MKGPAKKTAENILYAAAVIALTLAVWAIAARFARSEFVLPTISQTVTSLGDVFRLDAFRSGLCGTLLRCVIGFVISFALFSVTFALSVMFEPFRKLAEPFVSAFRSLPAVAITLILVLTVGGSGAPVALGIIVIAPMMYSSAKARTATVPAELAEVCALCGASRWQTFRALWLPALAGALPETLASTFSYNIKTVLGAEILAQTADSLGMLMNLSRVYLQTAMLIAFVLVAVVVSVVSETVIRAILKKVLSRYLD